MKQKLILILFLITNVGFAQNEANIWYFGENAGLDFNSGNPVALLDGQMRTKEGCASIADSNGNLQFYTDGSTIWTKDHSVMNNGTGLNGHFSSTQSAIIVPKPETPNIYYVFTVDFQGEPDGLQYSEIDMSLNGGLGAVTGTKNILLLTPVLEKLTAVQHANGKDVWVIVHKNGSAEFYAYQITSTGIQTPVITDIGFSYGGADYRDNAGYMKTSPDGTKLAMAFPKFTNGVQLFDFDNATGQFSNHRNFHEVPGAVQPYGLEFSPSGDLLYVSGSGGIGQFDTTQPTVFQMLVNFTFLSNEISNSDWRALQLAPDGKIYIARAAQDGFPDIHTLSVINNPDELGLSCDFQLDAISLGNGIVKSGLPPFIQSFFIVGFEYENLCYGGTTEFKANISEPYDSISWDFGDGNISTDENPVHIYSNTGDFTVTLSVTSGAQTSTETKTVTIYEQPIATKPHDILLCDLVGDISFDLVSHDAFVLGGLDPNIFGVNYYEGITNYNNRIKIDIPEGYINASNFFTQEIIAEVYNKQNLDCNDITVFNVGIYKTPKLELPNNLSNLTQCDNANSGSDNDGIAEFDLTEQEQHLLLNGINSEVHYNYFLDAALSQPIVSPSTFTNIQNPQTIYVEAVSNANNQCKTTTSFIIEVLELPSSSPIVELKQCDDDLDGFSIFNLTEVYAELSANHQNETITFYETKTDADNGNNPIANELSYANQVVSTDIIWARIENTNNCHKVARVNLIVSTTQIPNAYTRDFYECDDGVDITDGISSFDFSTVSSEIEGLFPVGQQLIINFYRNQTDALSETNPIADITNYQNIGYPYTQDIFIRVDSALDNDCLGLGHHITLHVEQQPLAHSVTVPEQCDDDGDGMYAFDTSQIETTLLGGQTNVTVTYTDENGDTLPSPLPNPFLTASQIITARVSNPISQDSDGACFDETQITFNVDAAAVAYPVDIIIECDDDDDGIYPFDTSLIESSVLNGQIGMIVSYIDEYGNYLPSPLPNPFLSETQTITVKVENPLSGICFDTTAIDFVVIDKPKLLMDDIWVICESDTVEIIADSGFDEYLWSTGETSQSITVDKVGSYEITASNVYNSVRCSTKKTVNVISSGIAKITDIKTKDWSRSENRITVFVEGTGDYEYSLDGTGYQDSNEFNNLDFNDYTVFVRDKNGCGITSEDIYLMYYPHFFTPNGDGQNDTWQIINSDKEPFNKIFIYDRYGKLLKQLKPTDIGWDGTFNGQLLSSNDYWFVLERQNGQVYKGHFSLKI